MRITTTIIKTIAHNPLAFAALIALVVGTTSCFKDEPLNAEADIEQVILHAEEPSQVFFNLTDTVRQVLSTDSVITVPVRLTAPLSTVSPELKLTPGATVSSMESLDTASWRIVVTSEDGHWHRGYTLRLVPTARTVADTLYYDFEHYELETKAQKYYVWHNVRPDGTLANDWSTANGGFQLSMGSALPMEYPTIPIDGYEGHGVQLKTLSTGPFGEMVNKRIAAGNMFLGTFDLSSALRDPLSATHFGIPFDMKPVKFTGYYRYTPGPNYQDRNGKIMAGVTDSASIYSVFYSNHDAQGNKVMLNGADVLTNENLVAVAKLNPVKATGEWTYFEVEFIFSKEVDLKQLENRGYNLAIVMSSSSEGDKFMGAVGSTLQVDKLRLICSKQE